MSEEMIDALEALRNNPLAILLDECVCRMMELDENADALTCYRTVSMVMEVLSEFDFDIARTDLIMCGTGLLYQKRNRERQSAPDTPSPCLEKAP